MINPVIIDTKNYSSDRLGINFETDQPICADDLADSFKGLSSLYKREVARTVSSEHLEDVEFRLYITKIESKCIDAELAGFVASALPVVQSMDYALIIDGFQQRFQFLVKKFAARGSKNKRENEEVAPIPLTEAKEFAKVIKAAGDGGVVMERRKYFENGNVAIEEKLQFSPELVRKSGEGVSAYIEERTQSEDADKKKVSLYLTRLDKDHHGVSMRSPERGIIESISMKSLSVHWISELDSKRIKSLEENLFSLVFTVDVKVEKVRGNPKAYRVIKLHSWEPIDEE